MRSRRQFLTGVTTAGTIAIAGCSGGGSGGGPEDAVEQYFNAGKNNDTETANEFLHPEAPSYPLEEGDAGTELSLNNVERATIREAVEVLEAQRTGESTEEEIQSEVNSTEQRIKQRVDDIGADEYSVVVVTVIENGEQRERVVLTVQDNGDWLVVE